MFRFNRFLLFLLVFPFFAFASARSPASAFDGWYAGVDAAFVSSRTEGTVLGPITGSVNILPSTNIPVSIASVPYGGTDDLPGGSLFAGYSKTFAGIFFISGELNGGYGSYDDTNAFRNDVFTSRIDVTQGYFGATARAGIAIPGNMLVYSSIGWAHNWIEAEGTINSFSLSAIPGLRLPPGTPERLGVNWPVKSDLNFDGITFGVGIEYGISSLFPLLKNAYLRLAYSRIEYAKEKFSYNATGFGDTPLPGGIGTLSINSDNIPAEADAGVHVFSLGLSYRFEI